MLLNGGKHKVLHWRRNPTSSARRNAIAPPPPPSCTALHRRVWRERHTRLVCQPAEAMRSWVDCTVLARRKPEVVINLLELKVKNYMYRRKPRWHSIHSIHSLHSLTSLSHIPSISHNPITLHLPPHCPLSQRNIEVVLTYDLESSALLSTSRFHLQGNRETKVGRLNKTLVTVRGSR
jgi:hypothetical protein